MTNQIEEKKTDLWEVTLEPKELRSMVEKMKNEGFIIDGNSWDYPLCKNCKKMVIRFVKE